MPAPRRIEGLRATLAALTLLLLLAAPQTALAVPSNVPVAGPQVSTDGEVRAIAVSGDRVYIGGSFTTVGGVAHKNLAALSATTGAVDPSFTGSTDGEVNALAVSGARLYVGGFFHHVGTQAQEKLAAVDAATGAPITAFAPPIASGVIRAVAATPTRVYAGGTVIQDPSPGGVDSHLRAFNATDGTDAAGFASDTDNDVRALRMSGDWLLLGGDFTVPRRGLAAVKATTGGLVPSFNANVNGDVYALALTPARVYLSGQFSTVGAQPRVRIASVQRATGALASSWRSDAGAAVWALAASDSRLYAGGSLGSFGALGQRNVVAARLDNGRLSPLFAPVFDAAPQSPLVRAVAVSRSFVFAGGRFKTVAGQPHEGFAAFRLLRPANVSAPWIIGNPVTGNTIQCGPGAWRHDPTGFVRAWLRDGTPIPGATSLNYKVVKADARRNLACRVTAFNPAGSTSATSAPVVPARVDRSAPRVKILGKRLRLRNGAVRVKVRCPRSEKRCRGIVVARSPALPGKPIVGIKRFSVRGGRTAKLKLRLDSAARKLLRRRGRLRLRVRVNARDAAGNAKHVSRTLVVRP